MFPSVGYPPAGFRPRPRDLRARLIRRLDLAVEFVTLGEYGVEEVELPALREEARTPRSPSGACRRGRRSELEAPHGTRTRAGSVEARPQRCG